MNDCSILRESTTQSGKLYIVVNRQVSKIFYYIELCFNPGGVLPYKCYIGMWFLRCLLCSNLVFKYEKKLPTPEEHTPAGALNLPLPSLQFALLADLLLVNSDHQKPKKKNKWQGKAESTSRCMFSISFISFTDCQ